jgi:hypothetical protein
MTTEQMREALDRMDALLDSGTGLLAVPAGSATHTAAVADMRTIRAALTAPAAEVPVPEALRKAEYALWVCAEHNALHHGEAHNTVIEARAAHALVKSALAAPAAIAAEVPEAMGDEQMAEVLTTAYGSPEWSMDDVRAARAIIAARDAQWQSTRLRGGVPVVQRDASIRPPAGKFVLAWVKGVKTPIRAFWVPAFHLEPGEDFDTEWAQYSEEQDKWFCPEGWYEANHHEETHWQVEGEVFAWMSLPSLTAAPQAPAAEVDADRLERAMNILRAIHRRPSDAGVWLDEISDMLRTAQPAKKEQTQPKLIEYEAAHRVAFQAAAAFRPPYFGPGFRAHTWVVEAVRSAHMDGQRFAHGLPPIERTSVPTSSETQAPALDAGVVRDELPGMWDASDLIGGETDCQQVARGSHIKANMFHDAGAYAECGACGRYSDDPKTLSNSQPVCDCGEQHYWSGSFKPPGPDAKWSNHNRAAMSAQAGKGGAE